MRRAEIVTATLMAAFSIYLMWKSAELDIGWIEDEGPGGGTWPFWLAATMLVCSLWTMVNWYRRTSPLSRSSEPFMDATAVRMFVLVGGGVTAMIGIVFFLGMYGAIPLFMIYYLRTIGQHSWRLTAAISIAAPVIVFFFFDVTMRIVLPKGYLEPLFLPLYDIFL